MGKRILPNIPKSVAELSDIFAGVWGISNGAVSLGNIKATLLKDVSEIPEIYVDRGNSPASCLCIVLYTDGTSDIFESTGKFETPKMCRLALVLAKE